MTRPGSHWVLSATLACTLMLVGVAAWAQSVTASVDRTTIGVDDTVVLTVEVADPRPATFSNLVGTDFMIVAQAMRSSSQRDARGTTRVTSLTLRLRPVRTGTLSTGSVQVRLGGQDVQTEPITVEVLDVAPTPSTPPPGSTPTRPERRGEAERGATPGVLPQPPAPGAPGMFGVDVGPEEGESAFVGAVVTSDRPTVGQPIVVDYLLYTPVSALTSDGLDLSEPEFTDAWFLDVSEARRRQYGSRRLGTQSVRGALYDVQLLRSYAVVPLSEGELVIPELEIELLLRGGLRRGSPEQLASRPLLLDVVAPPADAPQGFSPTNVGHWTLNASVDRMQARVGDSVTLTVVASGAGLASRLVLPEISQIDGVRTLDARDDAESRYGNSGWLEGEATRRVTLVPEREGEVVLPALSWPVFDPWTGAYQTLTTEPITLTVRGTNPNWTPATEADPSVGAWVDELPPMRALDATGAVRMQWEPGPVWAAAVALPWCAVFAVWGVAAVSRRRASTVDVRRERAAGPSALRAVSHAGDPSEVARALRAYLNDVGVDGTTGLTTGALRQHVRRTHGEAGAAVAQVIERAERARFAGDTPLEELIRAAEQAVRGMEEGR